MERTRLLNWTGLDLTGLGQSVHRAAEVDTQYISIDVDIDMLVSILNPPRLARPRDVADDNRAGFQLVLANDLIS